MNTGLVIGKFLPLHNGHIALIDFAQNNCDKLIVLIHTKKSDYIDVRTRIIWLYEIFRDNQKISIDFVEDDSLPDSSVSDRDVSRIWAQYLSKRYPYVRTIFSSEDYGDYLAEYMDIIHIAFDKNRSQIQISATKIRDNPFLYWDYIPEKIRPYFIKKICIYGPESTGKSILTQKLAEYYKTEFVPEVARDIIGDRKVCFEDIIKIFPAHADEILKKSLTANRFLFVDSDYLTTEIYSKFYFNKIPDYPEWVKYANSFDLYLFCDIDTPWIEDPQRDMKELRKEAREWFMNKLVENNINFEIINGNWEERFEKAITYIKTRWHF